MLKEVTRVKSKQIRETRWGSGKRRRKGESEWRIEKQVPLYKVVGVIALYWCTSWAAIFMNKFVYTNLKKSFDAPYFITFVQFIAPTATLYSFSKVNKKLRLSSGFPDIHFSPSLARRVFPLSILFCLMVTMSNLCLKYVEVSFYQISRSLGIPMIPLIKFFLSIFAVISSYLLFGEKSSLRTVLSCITVVIGYYTAGVDGEINFSLRGTLFGVGASAVGTFYTIYLKRYLSNVVDNSWLLTFYTNFNSCVILPALCVVRSAVCFEVGVRRSAREKRGWDVAGIIGLMVGITTYLQIQYTSSLSHNISGVMKNCIQTFMGAYFYHTTITLKGFFGILLVVGGSLSYTLERLDVNRKQRQEEATKALLGESSSQELGEEVHLEVTDEESVH
ncbi:uncharacterized protein [Blastocystis hominis]|uniref:Sugar phosphate transporter domain-containing protein n=2 Tax=Blastocystis hominis TaxID=12968 RepID=D8MB12_BLAHO|nr:uncharacterized protein [Blastocystis hominis]CBK25251.2 unnamed protein product [Blastocystis hominis]|eukprot:XP_012899299.1 uncharacterized protein [Blastocystis hominis]